MCTFRLNDESSTPTSAVCSMLFLMPWLRQPESTFLYKLTEVPAGWSLTTVIDAFAHLAAHRPREAQSDRAREAVSHRLVELWAAQPREAEAWLSRCWERFATELAGEELLLEALLRHGAAQRGKYWGDAWRFSEAGLLLGEPQSTAAEREHLAAWYLQEPFVRDRCRELAERLAAAENPETARKRQKLKDEAAQRRRLEAELHRNRLAAAKRRWPARMRRRCC